MRERKRDLPRLLREVYERLYKRFGPQGWWPGNGPWEVVVGAILTQSANWANVERALARLKGAGALSPQALRELPLERVAHLIRPSGYFRVKARKLRAFAEHLGRHWGDDLSAMLAQPGERLREELLSIYGVGEETADDILLYAGGHPWFVVDAYTRRVLERLGVAPPEKTYRAFQDLFHANLPRDPALFNEYHALLVRLGKEVCRKRDPLCPHCPLRDLCPTGQGQAPPASPAEGKAKGRRRRPGPPPAGRRRTRSP